MGYATMFAGSNDTQVNTLPDWDKNTTGDLDVQTNEAQPDAADAEQCNYHTGTFANDQWSEVVMGAMASGVFAGPAVRCAVGAATYYGYYTAGDSGSGFLFKSVAGSWTQLGSTSDSFTAADVVRLTADGTTITPTINGSTTGTPGAQTDDSIASGKAGITGYADGATKIASWKGGDVGDTVLVCVGDAGDANIYGQNATYATARATCTGSDSESITLRIGQQWASPNFYIYRSFVKFDTSSIGTGNTVTDVYLQMVCYNDYSTTDFDVEIVKFDWSAFDPITTDTREGAYDGCDSATADDNIWLNTSTIAATRQQQTSGALNTAWINRTGSTYYGLRSGRDHAATEPSGNEYIDVCSVNNATVQYRPRLVITYVAGAPTITLKSRLALLGVGL